MDELLGKGLGIWMIVQLLFYMSPTLVPLALPLGIVLASIMTFGNLGESFELVAIKSSGVSLFRFMRPLFIFIVFISGLAFLFNNHVIPYANLKALSLLYDLRKSKPTFNIRPGIFNTDIENFSIRVSEKGDDGKTIKNVIIYDHSDGMGNEKIILAKEGEMLATPDKQMLIFRLKDGWRYEEYRSEDNNENNEQVRMYFEQWDKVFDLSSFRVKRTDQSLFKNAHQMMNVGQLSYHIDSFKRFKNNIPQRIGRYLTPYVSYFSDDHRANLLATVKNTQANRLYTYDSTFLETIPDSTRKRVLEMATSQVRSAKNFVQVIVTERHLKEMNHTTYKVEWHRKFTLTFACILLFLIGAPLGAIIRKGGIGMPLIVAIGFFVVFHIMSITGEKLAKSETLYTWAGMWMATAMLLPIAVVLNIQARNDSRIFSKEWYIRIWKSITGIFKKRPSA